MCSVAIHLARNIGKHLTPIFPFISSEVELPKEVLEEDQEVELWKEVLEEDQCASSDSVDSLSNEEECVSTDGTS